MSDGAGRLRWRDDVSLQVVWTDRTRCGGPLGTRLEDSLRTALAEPVEALGAGAPMAEVQAALARGVAGPAFGALVEPTADAWRIPPDVLTPDPALTTPTAVRFGRPGGPTAEAVLPAGHWDPAHGLFAALAGPGAASRDGARPSDIQALLDGLRAGGFVQPVDGRPTDGCADAVVAPGATFVGHSTVCVSSTRTRVIVDPFLLPVPDGLPGGYRPLVPAELGRLDAVLLTHAHPDHFDPGSLLRLPSDVPVVVPVVERETALAPDLVRRLAQLGFVDVRPRAPGAVERIGDVEVHVLAFHGEQPSDGPRLHEEARNAGNTYVVRTPTLTVACVADAGRDTTGDVREVAAAWRRAHGPVDVLFGGYRGWCTYPAQVLLSSVGRFFLFLDPASWSSRLQLMNDADDAVDTAERFGARWLVPYSAGGAPWYWERGLGPRADTGLERPGFDPLPERVADAATRRSVDVAGASLASPVEVVVLRPGDAIGPAGPVRGRPGHAWPYGPATPHYGDATAWVSAP